LSLILICKISTLPYSYKPTTTDCLIPFNSNHPFSQKVAALNSFFHRLFTIPMSQHYFNIELSWITTVALNNNFPEFLVNKIYFRHFNKFINKNLIIDDRTDDIRFFSMTFLGPISLQLKNLFRSHDINICFKVQHTSRHFLSHSKDPTPQLHRSGINSLAVPLNAVLFTLARQAGGLLFASTFMKTHERQIDSAITQTDSIQSNFARHLHFNNHSFNIEQGFKVLHFCEKGNLLNLLEGLEINSASRVAGGTCLNDQRNHNSTAFFRSDGISNPFSISTHFFGFPFQTMSHTTTFTDFWGFSGCPFLFLWGGWIHTQQHFIYTKVFSIITSNFIE